MLNYHKNNKFCITKESKILFSQIENLFDQIEQYDISHTLLNNKCFEWSSEAYGIPENANKLTITKNNDNFTISFLKNPNNKFNIQNICAVCFCLNGSKNEQIANAFSTMIYEYINNQEENTDKHKTLINKR